MKRTVLFLLTSVCFNTLYGQAWELKKDEDSIQVYTRNVPNVDIEEFKAEAYIEANLDDLFEILTNVKNYPQWVSSVEYGEKLAETDSTLTFYYQIGVPWPAKNRDMGLNMHINRAEDSFVLKLESNPGSVPVRRGFIRMMLVQGKWEVDNLDDKNVLVSYQFLADPEGSLPSWIINMFLVDDPFKTMQNLREHVKAN